MDDLNSQLQLRLNELLQEFPTMPREEAAMCFQACVDGVQPTIASLTLEVASMQDEIRRLTKEHNNFVTRITRLFLKTKDCCFHDN
jgi:hypothetical protein